MTRVYVDTNVFLYAIGAEARYREPCRALVRTLAGGELNGETSVETMQEVVHHRRRRGDPEAPERGRRAADLCAAVHAFDRGVMTAALELIDRHRDLPTRDAVHAATALAAGIELMVSADRGFDPLPGLTRVDPCDAAAIQRLVRPAR